MTSVRFLWAPQNPTHFCLSPRGSLLVRYAVVTRKSVYTFESNVFRYLFPFLLPRSSLVTFSCQFQAEGCGSKSPASLFRHTMSNVVKCFQTFQGQMYWIGLEDKVTPTCLRLYSASIRANVSMSSSLTRRSRAWFVLMITQHVPRSCWPHVK